MSRRRGIVRLTSAQQMRVRQIAASMRGATCGEIAEELHVSRVTVGRYLARISSELEHFSNMRGGEYVFGLKADQ